MICVTTCMLFEKMARFTVSICFTMLTIAASLSEGLGNETYDKKYEVWANWWTNCKFPPNYMFDKQGVLQKCFRQENPLAVPVCNFLFNVTQEVCPRNDTAQLAYLNEEFEKLITDATVTPEAICGSFISALNIAQCTTVCTEPFLKACKLAFLLRAIDLRTSPAPQPKVVPTQPTAMPVLPAMPEKTSTPSVPGKGTVTASQKISENDGKKTNVTSGGQKDDTIIEDTKTLQAAKSKPLVTKMQTITEVRVPEKTSAESKDKSSVKNITNDGDHASVVGKGGNIQDNTVPNGPGDGTGNLGGSDNTNADNTHSNENGGDDDNTNEGNTSSKGNASNSNGQQGQEGGNLGGSDNTNTPTTHSNENGGGDDNTNLVDTSSKANASNSNGQQGQEEIAGKHVPNDNDGGNDNFGGGDGNGGGKDESPSSDSQQKQDKTLVTKGLATPSSGSFMAYFLTAVVLCIAGYVVFHNKQKIIAFIIEGRSTYTRRRMNGSGEYKKLQSNVEEVMPALDKSTSAKNFIY